MRILVVDGNTRSALAITRSLGRAGHEVFVGAEDRPCLAGSSRYARRTHVYPPPDRAPHDFVHSVAEACRHFSIKTVVPTTDVSTLLLSRERGRLPAGCSLPITTDDALQTAADKANVVNLAREIGISVPRTQILASPSDSLADWLEGAWPVVVKPSRSRVQLGDRWLSSRVTYAGSRQNLTEQLNRISPALFPVLLQERVIGPGVGVFTCFRDGRPVALFAHRRIREKPPSGGVSVLCESIPVDERAARDAVRLLEAIHWDGVAMVEFKRDNRDGSLRLMEINGRFWGSLQLAIDAGVDFPTLLVDPPTQSGFPKYRIGVRSRWFWGDVDSLLAVLLKSRSSLHLPPDHPGRLRTLLEFLNVRRADNRSEVMRLEDPLPGLLETFNWLRGRR